MRKSETFGSETSSGANERKSTARRASTSIIGARTCCSYSALRARNHSRSLLRFNARRKERVFEVNIASKGTRHTKGMVPFALTFDLCHLTFDLEALPQIRSIAV